MIQTMLSWIWIFVVAYLLGFASLYALNRKYGKSNRSLDVVLLFGLCAVTVYAQFFSLFRGVGAAATIVLVIGMAVTLILLRRELWNNWKAQITELCKMRKAGLIGRACIIFLLVLAVSLVLTRGAQHYDTYLYHAQSIRWIEEYGVVPGLGVLHNRLAYNSSFFALQALFSFHFLGTDSMFSVNGFVTILLMSYAVCSIKFFRKKSFFVSDFLRISLVLFFLNKENYSVIGSPGTDIFALGLVIYILIKWLSYWEDDVREIGTYAELCLLAVFAVSLKLSAAMIVLLAVSPAVYLLRKKCWAEIGKYIGCGLLIVLPWLIRNVVISGYLIYPYPELDLFDVDWKMPEYTLLFDRNEIKAWGWGVNDVYQSGMNIKEWFPIWYGKMKWNMQLLFVGNVLLMPVAVAVSVVEGVIRKEWNYLQVVLTIVALSVTWFVGAPLPRYGFAYMLLLPLLLLGYILRKVKVVNWGYYAMKCVVGALVGYTSFILIRYGLETGDWIHYQKVYKKYVAYACEGHLLENDVVIYTPVTGDQTGYYDFPATPYAARLQLIELRGDSLSDGFRMKEQFRNANVTSGGSVEEKNIFNEK